MVTLRPMTTSEFEAYIPVLREGYARDRAKNLRVSLESQLAEADQQISGLLQDRRLVRWPPTAGRRYAA
jgi:hypothetical protein